MSLISAEAHTTHTLSDGNHNGNIGTQGSQEHSGISVLEGTASC